MRKVIDIPNEIVKDLKKLAIDQDKDLKNFIQGELKNLSKTLNRSRLNMAYNVRVLGEEAVK